MSLISLGVVDLGLCAVLVLLLALLNFQMDTGNTRALLIASLRTTIQLALVGLVLKVVFESAAYWIAFMALIMLSVAGYEVMVRQKYRFSGGTGYALGAISMFISSFAITLFALLVVVSPEPWYTPQYAIPLLGMLLGNTMNGVAIGMDRLTSGARQQRTQIEQQLLLGMTWREAMRELRRDSIRAGMIPIINAMSTAGIVSLPGMMTGQILSGTPPLEAVKYQIMIMLLIGAGTGFGTLASIELASRRLFDDRHRLRLERLQAR